MRAEGRKAVNFALGVLIDCLLVALVGRPLQDSTTVCWNVTDVWALPLGCQQCHKALHCNPLLPSVQLEQHSQQCAKIICVAHPKAEPAEQLSAMLADGTVCT